MNRGRLIDRLVELVRIPSENPPGNEAKVAELVAASCDELGLEVSLHEAEPGRPSVVARMGAGPPTLTYCSHIDVVPAGDPALWEVDPYGAEIRGETLYGRGSADAKGPVAAALEAVAALSEAGWQPRGTLELALVADEETMGFKGAGHLVDAGILTPEVAVVGEPTSLRVVHAQRGATWCRIVTKGRAAHGSAPERGVNAIAHMAEIVLRLEQTLPDIDHGVLGRPSVNVGTIRGGEKTNIVPASCVVEVDRRTVPGEDPGSVDASIREAIDLARERFPDLDAEVVTDFVSLPFETPTTSELVLAASEAVEQATGEPAELAGFRGASDARFLSEAGAEVIVLGPGDIRVAHTAAEHIPLGELEACAGAYALLFARALS